MGATRWNRGEDWEVVHSESLDRKFGNDPATKSGWYWYCVEYPDEGVCGPFVSAEAACADAIDAARSEGDG